MAASAIRSERQRALKSCYTPAGSYLLSVVYASAVIVGFAAALLACAIWVVATFIVPLMLPMVIDRLSPATTGGVGMSVAYISTGPLVLIAIVAFAAGFTWRLRKHRRASH
jgi:hypothetical protein